jgi:hypothetical protein
VDVELPAKHFKKEKFIMSLFHAIAFVDHQSAQVLQFDSEDVLKSKIHSHLHYTRQHGSEVRDQHEFFGEVCNALAGISEVLVVGGHNGLEDFRHYVDKHRPLTGQQISQYKIVDHPTDNQLVALAREFFSQYDLTTGRHLPN